MFGIYKEEHPAKKKAKKQMTKQNLFIAKQAKLYAANNAILSEKICLFPLSFIFLVEALDPVTYCCFAVPLSDCRAPLLSNAGCDLSLHIYTCLNMRRINLRNLVLIASGK